MSQHITELNLIEPTSNQIHQPIRTSEHRQEEENPCETETRPNQSSVADVNQRQVVAKDGNLRSNPPMPGMNQDKSWQTAETTRCRSKWKSEPQIESRSAARHQQETSKQQDGNHNSTNESLSQNRSGGRETSGVDIWKSKFANVKDMSRQEMDHNST